MKRRKTISIIAFITLLAFCCTQTIPAYAFQDKLRQTNAGASGSRTASSIGSELGIPTNAEDLRQAEPIEYHDKHLRLNGEDNHQQTLTAYPVFKLPKGNILPVVTPLKIVDGAMTIDVEAVERYFKYLYEYMGVRSVLLLGATGEFHFMSPQLRRLAIEAMVPEAKRYFKVFTNITGATPQETRENAQLAQRLGSDAAVTCPLFYLSGNNEIIPDAEQLKQILDIPLIYYSNPGLPQCQNQYIEPVIAGQLIRQGLASALKDSLGNPAITKEYIDRGIPTYTGDESGVAYTISSGGYGGVLSSGSVMPLMQDMCLPKNRRDLESNQARVIEFRDTLTVGCKKIPQGLKFVMAHTIVDGQPICTETLASNDPSLQLTSEEKRAIITKIPLFARHGLTYAFAEASGAEFSAASARAQGESQDMIAGVSTIDERLKPKAELLVDIAHDIFNVFTGVHGWMITLDQLLKQRGLNKGPEYEKFSAVYSKIDKIFEERKNWSHPYYQARANAPFAYGLIIEKGNKYLQEIKAAFEEASRYISESQGDLDKLAGGSLEDLIGIDINEFSRTIIGECQRGIEMLADYLDEDGDKKYFDAKAAVDSIFSAFGKLAAAQKQGIRFKVEADGGVKNGVYMNPARFQRIVRNLITNSMRFIPNNGSITARLSDENNNLVIRIIDTGSGIPETIDRGRLFEPGVSSKDARPGAIKGRGLSICKSYLNEAGGDIALEKSGKSGTTFKIILPPATANAAAQAAASAKGEADAKAALLATLERDFYIVHVEEGPRWYIKVLPKWPKSTTWHDVLTVTFNSYFSIGTSMTAHTLSDVREIASQAAPILEKLAYDPAGMGHLTRNDLVARIYSRLRNPSADEPIITLVTALGWLDSHSGLYSGSDKVIDTELFKASVNQNPSNTIVGPYRALKEYSDTRLPFASAAGIAENLQAAGLVYSGKAQEAIILDCTDPKIYGILGVLIKNIPEGTPIGIIVNKPDEAIELIGSGKFAASREEKGSLAAAVEQVHADMLADRKFNKELKFYFYTPEHTVYGIKNVSPQPLSLKYMTASLGITADDPAKLDQAIRQLAELLEKA